MRTRFDIETKQHTNPQIYWRGRSSSTGTVDDASNSPASNLEWGALKSLSCRFFDDTPTTDFIRRQASGELIVNPMQSIAWSLDNPLISQQVSQSRSVASTGEVYDDSFHNEWSSLTWSGVTIVLGPHAPTSHDAAFDLFGRLSHWSGHSSTIEPYAASVKNAAVVRFRTDYADMVDILLSDRDATSLIPGILRSVLRLTEDFERRRLSAAASDLGKLWLAYRYGVRPLLYDLRTILRALSKENHVRRSFRSKTPDIVTDRSVALQRYGITGNYVEDTCSVSCLSRIILRSSFRAGITADLVLDDLSDMSGFRWDQLLPTMWDITPYSFLVDWVLNVSEWLTNFAPTPKVAQQIGFVTHSCNISVQGSSCPTALYAFPVEQTDSYYGVTYTATNHVLLDKGYTLLGRFRARTAFGPSVSLEFDPISWINPTHVADLLAIITGFDLVRSSMRRSRVA